MANNTVGQKNFRMKTLLCFLVTALPVCAQETPTDPEIDLRPFEPLAKDFFDSRHKSSQPQTITLGDVAWPAELTDAPGEADVTLLVRIDAEGRPTKIQVFSSPGDIFSRECVKAARHTRWVGVGKEVSFYFRVVLSFHKVEKKEFIFPQERSPEPKPVAISLREEPNNRHSAMRWLGRFSVFDSRSSRGCSVSAKYFVISTRLFA